MTEIYSYLLASLQVKLADCGRFDVYTFDEIKRKNNNACPQSTNTKQQKNNTAKLSKCQEVDKSEIKPY
jgi:hypothetical protein